MEFGEIIRKKIKEKDLEENERKHALELMIEVFEWGKTGGQFEIETRLKEKVEDITAPIKEKFEKIRSIVEEA